jgi:hypothetical protein
VYSVQPASCPVLASFNAEFFPTALRGDAYGWANNGIGRIGNVLSPVVIGACREALRLGCSRANDRKLPTDRRHSRRGAVIGNRRPRDRRNFELNED